MRQTHALHHIIYPSIITIQRTHQLLCQSSPFLFLLLIRKLSDPDKLIAFHPKDEFSSAPTFNPNLQFDTFDQMQSYVKSYANKMHFKVSVNSSSYKDGIAVRGYFY
jgi:hypothetical protein